MEPMGIGEDMNFCQTFSGVKRLKPLHMYTNQRRRLDMCNKNAHTLW